MVPPHDLRSVLAGTCRSEAMLEALACLSEQAQLSYERLSTAGMVHDQSRSGSVEIPCRSLDARVTLQQSHTIDEELSEHPLKASPLRLATALLNCGKSPLNQLEHLVELCPKGWMSHGRHFLQNRFGCAVPDDRLHQYG